MPEWFHLLELYWPIMYSLELVFRLYLNGGIVRKMNISILPEAFINITLLYVANICWVKDFVIISRRFYLFLSDLDGLS